MYQIYNNPTKFPLSQGQTVRRARHHHDKIMNTTIKKTHSAIDDSKPSHFPLRLPHSRKVNATDIKRENKRIVDSLLRAKSDSTFALSSTKNKVLKRERFFNNHRRRKWTAYKSEIQKQNEQMYKRIKNVKPSMIADKNDKMRRKRYLLCRRRARDNDLFAIPSPKKPKHHSHGHGHGHHTVLPPIGNKQKIKSNKSAESSKENMKPNSSCSDKQSKSQRNSSDSKKRRRSKNKK